MANTCKVGGCPNLVQDELLDHGLCLDHFLSDVQERSSSFARQLSDLGPQKRLQQSALKFVVLAAAKIATIGTQNPPEDQLLRGKLLNAMLLLAELRDRVDKTGTSKPKS